MALTAFRIFFLYNLKGNLSGTLRKEFQIPMVSIERDYHFQSDCQAVPCPRIFLSYVLKFWGRQ